MPARTLTLRGLTTRVSKLRRQAEKQISLWGVSDGCSIRAEKGMVSSSRRGVLSFSAR